MPETLPIVPGWTSEGEETYWIYCEGTLKNIEGASSVDIMRDIQTFVPGLTSEGEESYRIYCDRTIEDIEGASSVAVDTSELMNHTYLLELGPRQRVFVKPPEDGNEPNRNLPDCREITGQELLVIREDREKARREKAKREKAEREKMEKLLDVKEDEPEDIAAISNGNTTCAGDLRMLKEHLSEVNPNLPRTFCVSYPYGEDNLRNFEVIICPDEGVYFGGTFVFTFQIPPSYPHEPPKVRCKTKVNHPNISLEGKVSLDILSEAWNPSRGVEEIILGLCDLFKRPHPEDPLDRSS